MQMQKRTTGFQFFSINLEGGINGTNYRFILGWYIDKVPRQTSFAGNCTSTKRTCKCFKSFLTSAVMPDLKAKNLRRIISENNAQI